VTLDDVHAIERATAAVLRAVGEDPAREGLRDTPSRVGRFWFDWRGAMPPDLTTFDAEGADQMVVQTGIPVYSMCEHHLVPFFGTAVVAYLPDARIVGLSKLTRVVRHLAARPTNQERLTRAIADALHDAPGLAPRGVGVVLTCRHLCMEMRGVRAPGVHTTTSALLGALRDDAARAEFLSLAAGGAR
jgi:GTP cyclohydrolase I